PLVEAREIEEIGYRSERDDQVVVHELVRVRLADSVSHHHSFVFQVDRLNIAVAKLDALQKLSHWINYVSYVENPGGYLMQHRSEQEKIVAVDQSDLHIGIARQRLFEFERRINAGKPAAENNDLCLIVGSHDVSKAWFFLNRTT